jgi:hypothetical protein
VVVRSARVVLRVAAAEKSFHMGSLNCDDLEVTKHKKLAWKRESTVGQLEAAIQADTVKVAIDDDLDEVVVTGACPACKGPWDLNFQREPYTGFLGGLFRRRSSHETVHAFECDCGIAHKGGPSDGPACGCGRTYTLKVKS